jgi:RNA polymerase sigma factor (sigma-70 family)
MDLAPPARSTSEAPGPGNTLSDAWDRFYAECFEVIRRSPSVRKLSQADRDDCVQDVMMELVRRFGTDQPEEPPEGMIRWVRAVSRNKAADIVRRKFRKPEVTFDDGSGGELPDLPDRLDDRSPGPGETVSLVWEALVSLDQQVPVTSYLVFYLRTMEGWSIPEIAELFQITPEQARFRCHRVKKKFGALLRERRQESGGAP